MKVLLRRNGWVLATCFLLVASCATFQVEPARASNIGVSPVNIYLMRDGPSALLTVTNQDSTPVSFQVSLYAWNQSETGQQELAMTSDIVFFPTLLTIAPGESRKIRIGTSAFPAVIEKTYRIFLEELPTPQTMRSGAALQIRLLSKISLPIFVEPDKPNFQTAISDVAVRKDKLSLRIDNTGSVHILPSSVSLVGKDATGKVLFQLDVPEWYILAQSSLLVNVALPARSCAKTQTLAIAVQTDAGSVKKSFTMPPGACAP